MPLDDVLALATGARHVSLNSAEPMSQRDAIRTLGYRRAASVEEESKIAAALGELLADDDSSKDAASALGQRGHIEFVPQLLAMTDCDPYLFAEFWKARWLNHGEAPPGELVDAALHSPLEAARRMMLSIIADYKLAGKLREVENLLENDSAPWNRGTAAMALRKIGDRASAPALLRAVQKDTANIAAFEALAVVGSDEQVPALLALLKISAGAVQEHVLQTLADMPVTKSQALVDTFLSVLEKNPDQPSLNAASGLARFHDRRALPFLKRIVAFSQQDYERDRRCTRAIADAGGPDAAELLNEMLLSGWQSRRYVEEAMARLGDPSSARVVWEIYEQHPVRLIVSGWCATTGGYHEGLKVLGACADRELLEKIRARAAETNESREKSSLGRVVVAIERRLSGIPAGAPY